VIDRLFEPLFSTKSFGVGLGLPIAKGIMEQHGGGVEISSQKDIGTTVVLWLPKSNSL
jgi:signal transduction histidine kinase